jgi:hypothetical protein
VCNKTKINLETKESLYWAFFVVYNILMDIFTTGLIVLFAMTAIFYIVLFSFIYYWHLTKISFIVVPMFFTFDFFAIGFLVISIVAIILNYLPVIIRFFKL